MTEKQPTVNTVTVQTTLSPKEAQEAVRLYEQNKTLEPKTKYQKGTEEYRKEYQRKQQYYKVKKFLKNANHADILEFKHHFNTLLTAMGKETIWERLKLLKSPLLWPLSN